MSYSFRITTVFLAVFGLLAAQAVRADILYVSCQSSYSVVTVSSAGANLHTFASVPSPHGLAFDSTGNLYVADNSDDYIWKVDPAGQASVFVTTGLSDPWGLAFDKAGILYAANSLSGTIEKFSPSGVDLGAFATGLGSLAGLAFAQNGDLYVSNVGGTIVRVSPTGVVSFFADWNYPNPTGSQTFLAFDANGNLYGACEEDNTIKKITPDGIVSVFASSNLGAPTGMAFDSMGDLFVTSRAYGTVEEFSPTGTDLGTVAAGLSLPETIAVTDNTGNPLLLPVPEPASLSLLAAAGALMLRRSRRAGR